MTRSGKENLRLFVKMMAVDFNGLMQTPHCLHQIPILFRSICTVLAISESENPDLHTDESLANKEVKVRGLKVGKSFIKFLKRMGLRTHILEECH